MSWLDDEGKIRIGKKISDGFDWIITHLGWFFDGLEETLSAAMQGVLWLISLPNAYVMVALLATVTWGLQRDWKRVAVVVLCLLYVINQGYWKLTMESMTLILFSVLFCMSVGVPIGIYAARRPRFYQALQPVLDMMQTIPTPVYLIPMVTLFSIGMVPGLIASCIFVLPAPIRLAQLGISQVPVALTEAAQAFGATNRQTLWKVELPFAFPQIMTGLNQTIMLTLSMVVIAGWVGAPGLGIPVARALGSANVPLGFESGLVIVAVAIALDRMLRVERDQ